MILDDKQPEGQMQTLLGVMEPPLDGFLVPKPGVSVETQQEWIGEQPVEQ